MVRVKHRYLLVQIRCNGKPESEPVSITSYLIHKHLTAQIAKFYGEFGSASMLQMKVIYFNAKTHLCILRARHGSHRFITSILPLITQIGKNEGRYRTLYVGATLQQCQKFVVKYQQQYINKSIGDYKGMVQKQNFIKSVTNIKQL